MPCDVIPASGVIQSAKVRCVMRIRPAGMQHDEKWTCCAVEFQSCLCIVGSFRSAQGLPSVNDVTVSVLVVHSPYAVQFLLTHGQEYGTADLTSPS